MQMENVGISAGDRKAFMVWQQRLNVKRNQPTHYGSDMGMGWSETMGIRLSNVSNEISCS